jgi:small subunit ribosomal protein S12
MANKGRGLFNGRKLKIKRRKFQMSNPWFVKKIQNRKKKSDPLKGSSQAKGIVLEKREIPAKQPNSGLRKCCKVQLVKNGKQVTAFMPGDGAQKFIAEHDEVIIECIGGTKGRAKGDMPCIRWQVIKVNDQSLEALISGKIEKGRR